MKRLLWFFTLMMLLGCFTALVGAAVQQPDFKPVAEEVIGSNGITWIPKVSSAQMVLTVKRPDGTVFSKTFANSETPYIDLSGIYGESTVEGSYSYELLAVPEHEHRSRTVPETAGLVREQGARESQIQTGYFSVRGGMIVTANAPETGSSKTTDQLSRTADEVIYDDLIVDGSLCVGNDCYSGYAFGFDTIAMMENNLRIYFYDTSNTSSFPTNDWRIVINDTTDGGGSYFALQDVSGGKTPFTVEAGAKTNSLYVDDDGQVGIGTSAPVFELHIREGDTPTVRLHQDTSYGWPEQNWDVGGNETSFFIRDGSHAARLPFRIEPETPTNMLCLKADGRVGIGTWSPGFQLEVEDTGENTAMVVDRTDGATCYINATASNGNFGTTSDHSVRIVANGIWQMEVTKNSDINMTDGGSYNGTWNPSSSRELKENIKDLTVEEAETALDGLNPVKYNYKADKAEARVGFIAEDVPDLVAMNGRKTLGTVDIMAVLTKVLQQQREMLRQQQKVIDDLKEEVAQLKKK
jgi:hypothetical protein